MVPGILASGYPASWPHGTRTSCLDPSLLLGINPIFRYPVSFRHAGPVTPVLHRARPWYIEPAWPHGVPTRVPTRYGHEAPSTGHEAPSTGHELHLASFEPDFSLRLTQIEPDLASFELSLETFSLLASWYPASWPQGTRHPGLTVPGLHV